MQMQGNMLINDPELEAAMAKMLKEAKTLLLDGTGILVSPKMLLLLAEKQLLEQRTFGFWDVLVIRPTSKKTICIWPTLLGDEHYKLPPYARQMSPKY